MSQPSADLIRGVPLFADLDDKTVERLADEFIERHFDEGAAIATEGVDGLNFFIVESGEATVTVGGDTVGHARPGDVVRRGRARRQVGALGDGDRDDADGGVRAPGLELSAVRRAAPRARLEAARDARRATPRRPSPLGRPWPTPGAARPDAELVAGCRAGDAGGVERARRALLPLRLGDRHAGVPAPAARRRGRLPGRLRAGLRATRHAPLRRCDPALDRAADAQLLPRPPALVGPDRAGRGRRRAGGRRRDRGPRRGADRPGRASTGSRPSAARSSIASSPATRATARSATRSTFPGGTIASRISRCLGQLRTALE